MQRGSIWKLKTPSIAVSEVDNPFIQPKRRAVTLPSNALSKLLDAPPQSAFVQVEWERKRIFLFRRLARARAEDSKTAARRPCAGAAHSFTNGTDDQTVRMINRSGDLQRDSQLNGTLIDDSVSATAYGISRPLAWNG